MGRPRSEDPRELVAFRLRRSTLAKVRERAKAKGQTIGVYLAERLEATFGADKA